MVASQGWDRIDDHTGYLLVKLGGAAGAAFEAALEPTGLHTRHARVLGFVRGAAPSQQDLAARSGLDRTTMVAVVDELERRGYVRRERSEADRRKHVVRLTEAGARAYADLAQRLLRTQEEFFAALSDTERGELDRLLRRVFRAGPGADCTTEG